MCWILFVSVHVSWSSLVCECFCLSLLVCECLCWSLLGCECVCVGVYWSVSACMLEFIDV